MTAEFTIAVHALVYLYRHDKIVSSEELADNICTNPARVRKVMSKLHKASLVESLRGKGSGYHSTAGTGAATLDQILRALEEEPIAMTWRSGSIDKECYISSGMGAVMDDVYGQLNDCCHEKLQSITIESISHQISENAMLSK